ncbi:MAG: N-acetylmuramoyl-L-alanine amidase family protein, partial [Armatimonadaceae bacterium]
SLCRQVAQSITDRLRAEVGSIRTQAPRSDRTVYKSGFAVLRTSAMAGVLVETGFLSSPKDAVALRNPEVQRQIARSVASGLLDFLNANPDTDTRNVKPQKDRGPVIEPEEEPDVPPAFLPELPPPPPADDQP